MLLEGKKGLVLNAVNERSLAWAIAKAATDQGAEVGVGAQNERFLTNVAKLVENEPRMRAFTVDFGDDAQIDALVAGVREAYGKIDFVVHSAAFAPRDALTNPFLQTKRDDFMVAMDASCYSLVALSRALEPVMNDDASVVTISYLGGQRAARNYNVMGVCKAALESTARYLAVDLGERGIRVNVLSPGPVNTVAARGVPGLLDMIAHVQEIAPLKRPFGQAEVGASALYLLSDLSRGVTAQVIFVDSGFNAVTM